MKKTIVVLAVVVAVTSVSIPTYASDWDKAGKALAVIEGVRIITGGNVDLIGNLTGINRNNRYGWHDRKPRHKHARRRSCSLSHRVWVPDFKWKKEYIPEHTEYSQEYGKIIVEGHYIRYKVERGGHWTKTKCYH